MTVGTIGEYSPAFSYDLSPYGTNHSNQNTQSVTPTDEQNKHGKSPKTDKSSPDYECETCKNRKYQDGSDEVDVSFKSASHIAPEAAASAVRAHEQMHVSNAYQKAEQDNGKVVSANVTIHTSICPECGRSYVSGGTTETTIKYVNEDNPYQKDLKAQDASVLSGANINYAV
ncbi:MAG: hypothetical protein IJ274_13220 [Lachnospiraceae bacterium]|nr:hypothetical protein [Lachnospiraceae bacterium]